MDGRYLSLRKRLGLELFRRLRREVAERHTLRTLFWECTLRCNLRCGHCGSDCTASPTAATCRPGISSVCSTVRSHPTSIRTA